MRKILVFQHIPREHASHIASYADERSYDLDVVRFWEPYSIPRVEAYDGLVVLGGTMGAYEEFPWKEEELSAIADHVGNVPMLGVCLGAQLIAYALGADVYPHKRDGKHIKEVGHYTVELTEEGKGSPLFKGFPHTMRVLQWHGDTFDLPENAVHLAKGDGCLNQAFSYGNAYGLQFHFEITADLLRTIAESDKEWAQRDFSLDEEKLFREAEELEPMMKKRCFQLMDNFLSV